MEEKKQKVGQIRKKEILDAAKRVFLRKGFADTVMEDIITETSLSRGSVYYHYKNKVEDQEIKVELLKEEPTNKKPGLLMNRNSRGPAKSGTEHNNVITKTEFFHDAGGPLQVGDIVVKWERIKIQMDFELPDNTVHQGDTTVISLPAQLKFGDNSGFPVKDASGNVVANAVINESAKTVTLTYTDYPQNHSGVKGKLFFFARINHEEYDNEQDIPITINVGSTVIPGPTVHFEGVPDKEPKTFDKGSWKWQDRKFSYSVNINQKKQVIKNVVITDEQQNKGVTIDISIVQVQYYM